MASTFASEVLYNTESVVNPTVSLLEEEEGEMGGEGGVSGFRLFMTALYLVVCVAGLGGNSLVMAATLKLDRLGSAATVYIFNLALADGLFMVGLPFIVMQNFWNSWPFGDVACKLVMALDGVNQFTSVFCLTAMSVDRYVALGLGVSGRFAEWRTPGRAKVVAGCLWLLSLAPVLPMALHFSATSGLCMVEPPASSSDSWWVVFLACTFVVGFAVPFGVMIIAYAALLAALRKHGSDDGGGRSRNPESQQQERQVTRMVVAVVVAFAICWLPFYILNFCSLSLVEGPSLIFAQTFEFAVLISYSWSCANPILYACLSQTFREHFRALLCPKTLPSAGGYRSDELVTERYDLPGSTDGRTEV